jgi:hypothetical protein
MFKIQTPEDKLSQTIYNNTFTTKETTPYLTISNFTPTTTMNNYSFTKFFERTENRLAEKPPIYYIRKIPKPYKYDITSIPQGYSNKITTEDMFNNRLIDFINRECKGKFNINDVINSSSQDKYKPKGYVFRDFLIKNSKLINQPNILSSNYGKKLKKMLNYDEIKKKSNCSQIKFDITDNIKTENNDNDDNNNENNKDNNKDNQNDNKEKKKKENLSEKNKFYMTQYPKLTKRQEELFKHKVSDIFNLKEDEIFKKKSGEKSLFKQRNNTEGNILEQVYMTNKSNSNWAPKKPKKLNHVGYTSVDFNIIVPNSKSTSKTKKEIENVFKCNNRVKSMSEFIDLCRVSATNKSENYEKIMNKTSTCFRKRNGIGADYLNMFNSYKQSIPRAFS